MTQPDLHAVAASPPPQFTLRAARRLRWALRWRSIRSRALGPARMLPGIAAAGCGFAGALLLWGLGWALLVAAAALLLVDARTPRA
jgi:hypothetical protein